MLEKQTNKKIAEKDVLLTSVNSESILSVHTMCCFSSGHFVCVCVFCNQGPN